MREWTEAPEVTRGQQGVNGALSVKAPSGPGRWQLRGRASRTGGDMAGEKMEASLWSPQPV